MSPWLFDLDGVFADWNHAFLQELVGPDAVATYDPTAFPQVWDWPAAFVGHAASDALQQQLTHRPDWWAQIRPYRQVREVAERLFVPDGRPKFIITIRTGLYLQPVTEAWVRKYLGHELPVLTHVQHKGLIARALQPELAVDDKPEFCLQYVDAGVPRVVVIDRPYNRTFNHPRVQRVALADLPEVCAND